MRHNERGSVGIFVGLSIALIVLLVIGFFWQRGFMPHVGAGEMAWWQGFAQGVYAVPNFIVNLFDPDKTLEIYQSGAGGWYQFWWLVGAGALLGGGSSASRR